MSDAVQSLAAQEEARYRALQVVDPRAPGALETFTEGLHDESWRVRHAAAEGLRRLPDAEGVVTRLISVLGERGETGARNAAAEALAGMGTVALRPLVQLLEHEDPDQRKLAVDILGQLGRTEVEDVILRSLSDVDLNVRVSAAEALGRIGGEAAVRALEALLDADTSLLRLAALEGLAALRKAPSTARVMALVEEPLLQRSALRLLGLCPPGASTERICRALASSVRSVREAALVALGTQATGLGPYERNELDAVARSVLAHTPEMTERVAQALDVEDVRIRAGALVAAGALGEASLALAVAEVAREDRLLREVLFTLGQLGTEGRRLLLNNMGALSLPARTVAAEALVLLVDATSVPELCALLEWAEDDLRAVVVRALGRTRSPEALLPLVGLLADASLSGTATRALDQLIAVHPLAALAALETAVEQRTTPVAVAVLGRLGGVQVLPLLRRLARDVDAPWRAAAVEAASRVSGEAGLELARGALADESAPVRIAAVRAMGRQGGREAGNFLGLALKDEDRAVRLAAVEAVGVGGATERALDLEALVRHGDGALAVLAVRALAKLGKVGAGMLWDALGHPDTEVVKAALAALTSADGAADGAALAVSLVGHPRWDVRAAAARVLGDLGRPECLPVLQQALAVEHDALARKALVDAVALLSGR
ncbi:HEAT repeat domain-containing protein [Corallococcus sp. bb12-1]|uniref:HEAT repeat domain-containing protein n=1 Tax=Corallococcus sp. bb12-1 TaxID=2996784 RepID=UPI0022722CB6|nr:HEAT repeat domain-containing protein [Corallococcus sp. bb12-1]MCY1041375.1 HEAT repeat domain-containing protein [Corallococcus sp. bb12-1]